tara:strand:+ start:1321 stop:2364 length:1044 start_codon:yes stop_codon:yes gene_type:complete
MKALILNARMKNLYPVRYCIENDWDFTIVENATYNTRVHAELVPYTTFIPNDQYVDPNYYVENLDFTPDWIFNYREEYRSVSVEHELSKYYETENQFDDRAFEFFVSKKEQDRILRKIGTPTLENDADKMMVKLDYGYGGGAKYYVADKETYKPRVWAAEYENVADNDYTQRYIDIDYHVSIHVIIDAYGQASIVSYEYFKYGDDVVYPQNHAYLHITPHLGVIEEEKRLLEYTVKELFNKHITVKNRIICWQWLREKDGPLWPVDFNARPAGGVETGMYDFALSDFHMLDAMIKQDIPDQIEYTNMVTWLYQHTGLTQTERLNHKGDIWQADQIPIQPQVMKVFKS